MNTEEYWRTVHRNEAMERENRARLRRPEMYAPGDDDLWYMDRVLNPQEYAEPGARRYLCCGAWWEDGCQCEKDAHEEREAEEEALGWNDCPDCGFHMDMCDCRPEGM